MNDRKVDRQNNSIQVSSSYPNHKFDFNIEVVVKDDGILLCVIIDNPLLKELENKTGFNLEFLPSPYFEKLFQQNPFGIPIIAVGLAGSGMIVNFAKVNYLLHKTFPKIISSENCLHAMNFIFSCHSGSNVSLVSAVGTHSKRNCLWK